MTPPGESLAVGLGWFSMALGVAELAAPHSVARLIGVAPTEKTITTLRSYGAREVGVGVAILAQPDRATWALREMTAGRGRTRASTPSASRAMRPGSKAHMTSDHPPDAPGRRPRGFETFSKKEDECVKVVLRPH